MILQRLLGRKGRSAGPLYRAIVTAARQPRFYAEWNVPDTVDGRFDMIVLHLFLIANRLKGEAGMKQVSQELTDAFFDDMDRSLREMGVGDLSVGRKVRKMAESCYGRLAAYDKAVTRDDDDLLLAIARNIFPETPDAGGALHLANWTRECRSLLASQPADGIIAGDITWP